MPFLGKDWRSPGDHWVKTPEGWESLKILRLKMFDNLSENTFRRMQKYIIQSPQQEIQKLKEEYPSSSGQPHVQVLTGHSTQNHVLPSISESLTRLDFCGAMRDTRRFNYVHKLIELLIQYKFDMLSGMGQKFILNLLNEMLQLVSKSQTNTPQLASLLDKVESSLHEHRHHHVGSAQMWEKHALSVQQMKNSLNTARNSIRNRSVEIPGPSMSDLPEECIREIVRCIPDHRDVLHLGSTNPRNYEVSEEHALWKSLCLFHFEDEKFASVIRRGESQGDVCWKELYRRLVRRYGMRELYAEMLYLCKYCNTLYWNLHGHPCPLGSTNNSEIESTSGSLTIPVSPVMCLELFNR